jgi:hypothetical protein
MKLGLFRKDRRKDRSEIPATALKKQLEHFVEQGGYKAAIMATGEGFIAVDSESGFDSRQQTDIARLLWGMSRTVYGEDLVRNKKQIVLRGEDGETIFCRYFVLNKQLIALIFLGSMEIDGSALIESAVEGISRIVSNE